MSVFIFKESGDYLLFTRNYVCSVAEEDAIGNDRNIENCVQVVITAHSYLLATARLFAQYPQSVTCDRWST